MKKFKLLMLLIFPALVSTSLAQNNSIFRGGNQDGMSAKSLLQNSDLIFGGGNGDGHTLGIKTQISDQFFAGGNGDGQSLGIKIQNSDEIFSGTINDGISLGIYLQESDLIYSGGNGDGNNFNKLIQESDPIFKGDFGDGYASNYLPQAPLPLTLLSFTAKKYLETDVLLNWSSTREINTQSFIIERSANAINFLEIGTVKAINKSGNKNYLFIDENPKTGINYYRLKMMDLNGDFTYSPTRAVSFNDDFEIVISVFPNPSNGLLTLSLPQQLIASRIIINITAMNGIVVEQIKTIASSNEIYVDLSKLAKGEYYFQVISPDKKYARKITIL